MSATLEPGNQLETMPAPDAMAQAKIAAIQPNSLPPTEISAHTGGVPLDTEPLQDDEGTISTAKATLTLAAVGLALVTASAGMAWGKRPTKDEIVNSGRALRDIKTQRQKDRDAAAKQAEADRLTAARAKVLRRQQEQNRARDAAATAAVRARQEAARLRREGNRPL